MRGDPGPGSLSDLNFDDLIRSYVDVPRFVRREWWAGEITAALSDPGCTYLLLTAEPGAGKTALIAQLAQDNQHWPRYFLRRDQQQPLGDSSARAVLLRLGMQLATARQSRCSSRSSPRRPTSSRERQGGRYGTRPRRSSPG